LNRRISVLAVSFIAAILMLSMVRMCPTAVSADAEVVAFVGEKKYTPPPPPPISNGTVVIRGEKIAAVGKTGTLPIPPDAKQIDCKGAVITAAFQNSHVHFAEQKWIDAATQPAEKLTTQLSDIFTRYGFTTVVDTGSPLPHTAANCKRIP